MSPFAIAGINDGTQIGDGLELTLNAHIMDVVNDRYKLSVVGDDDDELLLEMPLIPHDYLFHFKKRKTAMKKSQCFHESIHQQEVTARNEIIDEPDRHQQCWHIKVPSEYKGAFNVEQFPTKRGTTGSEVDHDMWTVDERKAWWKGLQHVHHKHALEGRL